MDAPILYRPATEADAPELLELYRPYVTDTVANFETAVPSLDEFRDRIRLISSFYPYLVAIQDGKILGYCYASFYRPRAGFRWDAELSVYVRMGSCGHGIGTHLYAAMLDLLRLQGLQNAYAVVSHPNQESERLHEHFGFRCMGIHRRCCYKNGIWCDVALYERRVGDYSEAPDEPLPFSSLDPGDVARILKI